MYLRWIESKFYPFEIIDMIRDGSLFGAIEVDIEVPENLKEKFSEMTPIFKNDQREVFNYIREGNCKLS